MTPCAKYADEKATSPLYLILSCRLFWSFSIEAIGFNLVLAHFNWCTSQQDPPRQAEGLPPFKIFYYCTHSRPYSARTAFPVHRLQSKFTCSSVWSRGQKKKPAFLKFLRDPPWPDGFQNSYARVLYECGQANTHGAKLRSVTCRPGRAMTAR